VRENRVNFPFRPFSENSLVNQRVLFYNRRTTKEKKEGNP